MRWRWTFFLHWVLFMAYGCQSWGSFWFLPFSVDLSSIGGSNYSLSNPIYADFNIAADLSSLTANTTVGSTACTGAVQVSKDNFQTCISLKALSLSNDGKRLAITPTPAYLQNTSYQVKITTSAKSQQGSALSSDALSATYMTKDSGKWVFVGNYGSGAGKGLTSMSLNQTTGALGAPANTAISSTNGAYGAVIDPSGKYLLTWHNGGTTNTDISYATINQATGALNTPAAYSTANTAGLAIHPTLPYLYGVSTPNPQLITQYSINTATGQPTAGPNVQIATSVNGSGIAMHPGGKWVYGFVDNPPGIYGFQINQTTGALTNLVSSTTNLNGPIWMTFDPTGTYAYLVNVGGSINTYIVDQITGQLTFQNQLTGLGTPYCAAVDPTGRFMYVANNSPNSVTVHAINSTTGIPSAALQTYNSGFLVSSYVAVDPTGRFVLVNANTTTVHSLTINQSTGLLTANSIQTGITTQAQVVSIY